PAPRPPLFRLLPPPLARERVRARGTAPGPGLAGRGRVEAQGVGNSSRRRPLTLPRYPRSSMTMLDHARRMRRAPTRSEDRLWSWLRDRRFSGQKFRRQVPIGRYILDFYCPRLKLVIEMDGQHHRASWMVDYEDERFLYLHTRGIRLVRIPNEVLIRDYRMAIECIEA